MNGAGGPAISEELLAVIAAAAAAALRGRGGVRPVVTRVTPVTAGPGPSPWVWAGRMDLMAARRGAQRRGR